MMPTKIYNLLIFIFFQMRDWERTREQASC